MTAHCHKMLRKVAQELAGQLYEMLMSDNVLFEEWKKGNPGLSMKALEVRFIAKFWGKCLGEARATLALLLRDQTLPDQVKEDIMEALVLDASLTRGRQGQVRMRSLLDAN